MTTFTHMLARLCLPLALLAALSLPVRADVAKPLGKYRQRVWRARDGLPAASIRAITQDRDGYLWLSSESGGARFDGVTMDILNDEVAPLGTIWITATYCDPNGDLWVSTYKRLLRLRNGRWKIFADGSTFSRITQTPDGMIWVGTEEGRLLTVDRRENVRVITNALPSGGVMALVRSSDGSMWTGGLGLTRIAGGRIDYFGHQQGLPGSRVDALLADPNGDLWIGTDQGLVRMRGGRFESFAHAHPALSTTILSLLRDSQGTLWAGTRGSGVVRLRDDHVVSADKWPLSDSTVNAIIEDREHNLWFGTEYGGLNQLRNTPFATYSDADGIGGRVVTAVAPGRDGGIWLGTSEGSVGRIDANRKITKWSTSAGLPVNEVNTVVEDASGGVWAGTQSAGLSYLSHGKVTRRITKSSGLAGLGVSALLLDPDGSLWIGPFAGELQRWRAGRLTTYPRAQTGLRGRSVVSMTVAREGGLWIGTELGLQRFRGGRSVHFSGQEAFRDVWIRTIREDDQGVLWLATAQQGLARLKDGRVTWTSTTAGLCRQQMDILEDNAGGLLVSCERRVARMSKAELNGFADGTRRSLNIRWYDVQDGMRSDEFNSSATRSLDGSLWFATNDGVTVLAPGAPESAGPQPISMQRIEADGRAVDPVHPIRGAHRIVIFFTSPTLAYPERVRFRYRLLGFDTQWLDADRLRHAVYTNLQPGAYSFEVQATMDGVHWSAMPSKLALEIAPTLTQTRWFRMAGLLAGLALVLLASHFAHRVRERGLRQRQRELARVVAERTAQLALEKEGAEAVGRANAALSRRNQLILDSAAEGIFGTDASGRASFVNTAAATLLEWTPGELVGRELHSLVHPGLGTSSPTACPLCRVDEKRRPMRTMELVSRSGKRIPVDYTVADVHAPGEPSEGAVVTFRDVSERMAVERMKDEFVSTVSHELRTPLTSIRGSLGLIASGVLGKLGAKGQRMIDIALSNSDRLIRLINDILDVERLTSGRFELNRTTVDAADVVRQAVDVMRPMADGAGVRLIVDDGEGKLLADSDRIIQTLTNLIGNAIKFSPAGSTIHVSAQSSARNVVFRVADHGRGIPPGKLNLVFERFRQVDAGDAREKGGSGLGLTICRNIAEAHGGSLEVESTLGEGSTFSLTIPRFEAAA